MTPCWQLMTEESEGEFCAFPVKERPNVLMKTAGLYCWGNTRAPQKF